MNDLQHVPQQLAPPLLEAKRIAEVARRAAVGESPDTAVAGHKQALALLDAEPPSELAADVLRWQGEVLRNRGRTSEAEPLFTRSLHLSEKLGYCAGIAHALNCLAGLSQRRGDLLGATSQLLRGLELAEECGEQRLIGNIQQNLGILADMRGDTAGALSHYHAAFAIYECSNDEQRMCWLLINTGLLHGKEKRFDDADADFRRGLGIARRLGDLMAEGLLEENRAESLLVRGHIDEAYEPIRRVYEIAERRRDDIRRAAALKLRGAYERLTNRSQNAVETLRYALTLSTIGEDALLGAEILYQFGLALYDVGDPYMAAGVWHSARDAFERLASRDWLARVQVLIERAPVGGYYGM